MSVRGARVLARIGVQGDWVYTRFGRLAHIRGERRFNEQIGRITEHTLCGRFSSEWADQPVSSPGPEACEVCLARFEGGDTFRKWEP